MRLTLFTNILESISAEPLQVLDITNTEKNYIPIDLSETNDVLKDIDVSSSEKFSEYIERYLSVHNSDVAYGGYLENRSIYKRSLHFNQNDLETERNIHLGMDLWCPAGTKVLAALDGEIHSFKNNTNYGDYGPTIIIKHHVNGDDFYTLYGHLSLTSIAGLKIGETVKCGQCIGDLGASTVNGDYPPHLHFQIIKDMQGFEGDYPGVCNKKDVPFYKTNCPDPNLLLQLK